MRRDVSLSETDDDMKAGRGGNGRCGRILTIGLVLVLGTMALGMTSHNAAATTIVTGQNGWDGNKVIYMTSGIDNAHPPIIQGQFKPASQSGSGNSYNIANALNVSVGQAANTTNTNWMFTEYYHGGGSNPYLQVYFPVVAAGAGQQRYDPSSNPPVFNQVLNQQLSLSISNSPSINTYLQVQAGFDSGINTTGNIPEGTTREQALVNFGIDALSQIPFFGYAIGSYQLENDLAAATGVNVYIGSAGANGQVLQTFGTKGGNVNTRNPLGDTANNVFEPQEIVYADIPQNEWMSYQPVVTITATNLVGDSFSCYGCSPVNGATASITVNAVPAVTLMGQVAAAGKPLAGATVDMKATSGSQSGTTFQVTSDSNGNYRFFAQVGTTYSIWASSGGPFGTATSSPVSCSSPSCSDPNPTSMWANITIPSLFGYVKSSGNPLRGSGVVVTQPGGTASEVSTDATGYYGMTVPTNAYAYTIATEYTGYSYQQVPQVVSGGTAYLVDFNLTRVTPDYSLSACGSLTVPEGGSNTCYLTVSSVGGWSGTVSLSDAITSGSGGTVQQPSPSSVYISAWGAAGPTVGVFGGSSTATFTVTVTGNSNGDIHTASFTVKVYNPGGGGCVLSGTAITLPGGGGESVNDLKVGDTVLGYNITTGRWAKETVTSIAITHVSVVLAINNGLLKVTLTDQPLYVRNGTWTGWVHDPQNLTVGEQIFLPSTGMWVKVTSLQVLKGNFDVYDLRVTAPNDFVANGVLVGDKPT
jgi:hypothetical protein